MSFRLKQEKQILQMELPVNERGRTNWQICQQVFESFLRKYRNAVKNSTKIGGEEK